MLLLIITTILAVAFFSITFIKMVKNNTQNYFYFLGIQFVGVLIDFIILIRGKSPNLFGYSIIYLFSIVLPIAIILLEKKDIYLAEVVSIFLVNLSKKDQKRKLVQLANRYPESYYAHKKLAEFYEKAEENEKAEDEYYKVISIKPNDYKTYCKLSEILKKNQKTESSIELLQSLLRAKPDYSQASILLGEILYENENFKEAINVYTEALKYNPGDYDIYYALGMTYTRLNDFQNAKEYYKKAATVNSIKDIASLNLGQISLIFREYEEAEQYFFETINSEDEKIASNSYYYLAKIRLMQKNEEQAIQYANLAIEIYPKIIKKIEEDDLFITILSKIKKVKDKEKELNSQMTEKEEEIVEHLSNTFDVVETLTVDFKEKKEDKEIDY